MAVTPQPSNPPPHQPANEAKAAETRKIFDTYEDDDLPLTTQSDQLRRAMDMEKVGPSNWMAEQDRRIRERQGDPPIEPRQVHGVAPAKKP
jgi:hypothetical protein